MRKRKDFSGKESRKGLPEKKRNSSREKKVKKDFSREIEIVLGRKILALNIPKGFKI